MRAVRTALGNWLGEFVWSHAATLTFEDPPSADSAIRAVHRWLRDLCRRSQRRASWFFVMELTQVGAIHLHLLVNVDLSSDAMEQAWQPGFAKVDQYDPGRGWRHYIVKRVGGDLIDWDIDQKCIRK